jgi:hypothetical protein
MRNPSPSPAVDLSSLSPLLQVILLLFVVFAIRRRAKLAGAIGLATPAFVPLAADAASRFARDFGAAYAELIGAEPSADEA